MNKAEVQVYLEGNELESILILDDNESQIYKEKKTLNFLNALSKKSLSNIRYEHADVILDCEGCLVIISDYKKIAKIDGLEWIEKRLSPKEEKNNITNIKVNPKAKAKLNKNKKKKINRRRSLAIIGTVLIASTILAVSLGLKDKTSIDPEPISQATIEENIFDYEEPQLVINDNQTNSTYIIDYADRSETNKALQARENYYDVIGKYATMYGLDPNFMLALATQESGVHSSTVAAGGGLGLMQIQVSVWANNNITAYNFETNQKETVKVNPEQLKDLDYNVKIGCMIYANYLRNFSYNPIVALQAYNMGIGTLDTIISNYAEDIGLTRKEVLAGDDLGWMDYRDNIRYGDSNYIENVLSWASPNSIFEFTKTPSEEFPDGEKVIIEVKNGVYTKSVL